MAELHLGRLSEAEAALQEVIQRDARDVEAIANSVVLNVILGRNTGEVESLVSQPHSPSQMVLMFPRSLKDVAPDHPFLADLEDKESLFDLAATKYAAKVAG